MLRFVPRQKPGGASGTPEGFPPWLGEILTLRGIDSKEKADEFLAPSISHMHDPRLMKGMDAAVSLLNGAVRSGMPVVVYGDYDVDGVCSAAMMLLALRRMGAKADYYIPSRHGEGYGLNQQAVEALSRKYGLLLTVDCGITAVKEVKLAKSLGMGVIVTDHHQLGPEVPDADALLNPLMGEYPFRRLCGAGVAFKLLQALLGADAAAEYLDLAALATIADLVPLMGENRVIAALGLKRLTHTGRMGLRALMDAAGIGIGNGKVLTSGQVAFQLAPRMNAGGRLKSASLGMELLLAEDAAKAAELARTLNEENALRQKLEAEIFQQALIQVEAETDFLNDRVLVAMGEGWNSGVIGLAASRLTERFHYPSIVFSKLGKECVGSARSIPGVNIFEMLSACRDLFLRFGGHEQAAGLTLPAENVPELKRRLSKAILEGCDPKAFIPIREYDLELPLCDVTQDLVTALSALQPTGFGNPEPVFLLKDGQVQDMRPVGREGAHLKCSLFQEGALRSAIAFQMGPMAASMPPRVDVLYTPELNEWNGTVSVQAGIRAIRAARGAWLSGGEERAQRAAMQEIGTIAANDCKIPPKWVLSEESCLAGAFQGAQGTLILARAPNTASRIAMAYGDMLHVSDRLDDKRGFHTLFYPARIHALGDMWKIVVLADGELVPGEADLIRERCPRADILVFPPSQARSELLRPLSPSDNALRQLYAAARSMPSSSLDSLADAAGVSRVQALAGMHVFRELALVEFEEEPFLLKLLPPAKCRLEDSPTLRVLRAAE